MNGERKLAMPIGFFDFSKPQRSPSDLSEWRNWFQRKNIPTKIIRTTSSQFVLCIKGKPAGGSLPLGKK
jgi:hypothetical protein